jgi:translation initiation factor 2 alpha subunit (eIF-2alpha)
LQSRLVKWRAQSNFLDLFAAETDRYSKNISLRKSGELEERLAQTCQDLITKQIEVSSKEILCNFDLVIEEREPGDSFKSALGMARKISQEKFADILHGMNAYVSAYLVFVRYNSGMS